MPLPYKHPMLNSWIWPSYSDWSNVNNLHKMNEEFAFRAIRHFFKNTWLWHWPKGRIRIPRHEIGIHVTSRRQALSICNFDLWLKGYIGYLNNILLYTSLRQSLRQIRTLYVKKCKRGVHVTIRRKILFFMWPWLLTPSSYPGSEKSIFINTPLAIVVPNMNILGQKWMSLRYVP